MSFTNIFPILILIIMAITCALTVVVTLSLCGLRYMRLKAYTDAEHDTMKRTGYHPLICPDCKYREKCEKENFELEIKN